MRKNAADPQGSAFVKGPKKVDDVSFVSPKHLKETLLSEAAGSVQAGADVLQNEATEVAEALGKQEVAKALQVLNTLDASVEHTDEAVAKAVATLHAELCGKGAVEEALVKVTVAASRLYLLGHEPAAPAGLHEAPGLVDREAPRGRVGPQEGARLARRPQEQAEDVPHPGRHGG